MIEIPQEFIQDLRERYGVPGLGVVLVQNSKSENEGKPDLKTKIGTYGIANAQGDKVDEQVRLEIRPLTPLRSLCRSKS